MIFWNNYGTIKHTEETMCTAVFFNRNGSVRNESTADVV